MSKLKYAWLQDVLAELIRFALEMRLHGVVEHLGQALHQVRILDAARSERSEIVQSTTVKLALEDCLNILIDLEEHGAAEDVRNALRDIHHSDHAHNVIWLMNRGEDIS